jgi:lipoprotein-anchoring transpeptidase ErfK/SrfK
MPARAILTLLAALVLLGLQPWSAAVSSPKPVRWEPGPGVYGIAEPLEVTVPVPTTPARVEVALRVGRESIRLVEQSPTQYVILPDRFWPGKARVTFAIALARLYPSDLPYDATHPVSTYVLHTGPPVRVAVNLTTQTLDVYDGSRLEARMVVSTGAWPRYVTPTGTFWVWRRILDDRMVGGVPGEPDSYMVEHVPYVQYIWRGIAIHGAWWNRRFGRPVSHGCIQLATKIHNPHPEDVPEDAGWLWAHTTLGTPVTIYGTTPHDPEPVLAYPWRPLNQSGRGESRQ